MAELATVSGRSSAVPGPYPTRVTRQHGSGRHAVFVGAHAGATQAGVRAVTHDVVAVADGLLASAGIDIGPHVTSGHTVARDYAGVHLHEVRTVDPAAPYDARCACARYGRVPGDRGEREPRYGGRVAGPEDSAPAHGLVGRKGAVHDGGLTVVEQTTAVEVADVGVE